MFIIGLFIGLLGFSFNTYAGQAPSAQNEMSYLTQLEKQNPDLKKQVAGYGCEGIWDSKTKPVKTLCQSPFKSGMAGALVGMLVGTLFSSPNSFAIGGAIGFGVFYTMSYLEYGAD